MRFKLKNPEDWQEWYAWHPVRIDGKLVWGETVLKRTGWTCPGVEPERWLEYKLIP